jgi:hypothetical protein
MKSHEPIEKILCWGSGGGSFGGADAAPRVGAFETGTTTDPNTLFFPDIRSKDRELTALFGNGST